MENLLMYKNRPIFSVFLLRDKIKCLYLSIYHTKSMSQMSKVILIHNIVTYSFVIY